MKHDSSTIKDWVYSNSWNLLVTFVGIVVAFTLLRSQVEANAMGVSVLQNRLDKYPSEQYFNLKFQNQEEKPDALEKKVDDLTASLNKHLQEK